MSHHVTSYEWIDNYRYTSRDPRRRTDHGGGVRLPGRIQRAGRDADSLLRINHFRFRFIHHRRAPPTDDLHFRWDVIVVIISIEHDVVRLVDSRVGARSGIIAQRTGSVDRKWFCGRILLPPAGEPRDFRWRQHAATTRGFRLINAWRDFLRILCF